MLTSASVVNSNRISIIVIIYNIPLASSFKNYFCQLTVHKTAMVLPFNLLVKLLHTAPPIQIWLHIMNFSSGSIICEPQSGLVLNMMLLPKHRQKIMKSLKWRVTAYYWVRQYGVQLKERFITATVHMAGMDSITAFWDPKGNQRRRYKIEWV